MKKKVIFAALIIVIVLAATGGIVIYRLGIGSNKLAVSALLKNINIAGLNESQTQSFNEIKEKLMKDPNDYSGLLELALLEQGLNDYAGAIAIYERLQKVKSDDVLPLNNLGAIYYNLGDYEKAEQMYLKILNDITPKWLNSYNELFAIYQFHLKDKRATYEAIITRGIEAYPEMKQNLVSKAAVYFDEVMNDKAKALEYYKQLAELAPDDPAVKVRLSELKK